MISAVIFDFDGIIVDSEKLHWAAFNKVLEPLGKAISWPEYVVTFIGFDDRDAFRHAFPELNSNPPRPSLRSVHPSRGGESPPPEGCPPVSAEAFGEGRKGGEGRLDLNKLIEKKAAAFQELLESDGAAALPGSVALIKHLSGKIPIAICSGALRADIFPILGKLGIEKAFDTIVTADDTHISKPDPAPYKLAMERLAVAASGGRGITRRPAATTEAGFALAIEDTPAGIASAKGAGLKVLSVTNSYAPEFLTQADAVIASLEGLTLEKLNSLL
jgi:beta-phosphoglucomutase